VLPSLPSDPTPVTWTISNNPPPTSSLSFTKLPKIFNLFKKNPKVYGDLERKNLNGKLVLSTAMSYTSDIMSNKKLYEPGQILEFTDTIDNTSSINLPITPDDIITSHDVNQIDLESLGLTADEASSLQSQSYQMKLDIERSIMTIKIDLEGIKGDIIETQKKINESDRAIKATTVLLGSADQIVIKLEANKVIFNSDLTTLNNNFNAKSAELDNLYNQLTTINQLVK